MDAISAIHSVTHFPATLNPLLFFYAWHTCFTIHCHSEQKIQGTLHLSHQPNSLSDLLSVICTGPVSLTRLIQLARVVLVTQQSACAPQESYAATKASKSN